MNPFQKRLARKIERQLGITVTGFTVCRAGDQRDGVYRWLAQGDDGGRYHSMDTMSQCLASKALTLRRETFWFEHGACIHAD